MANANVAWPSGLRYGRKIAGTLQQVTDPEQSLRPCHLAHRDQIRLCTSPPFALPSGQRARRNAASKNQGCTHGLHTDQYQAQMRHWQPGSTTGCSTLTWLHVRKVHFLLVEDDSDIVCLVLRALPQLQNHVAAPQSTASGPHAVAHAPCARWISLQLWLPAGLEES